MRIDQKQLDEILNPAIKVSELEIKLGNVINEELSESVNHFEFNPEAFGRQMWEGFQAELYNLICKDGKPRDWAIETTSGDLRTLAVWIVSGITSQYDIGISIAIPLTGLIIKTGVTTYCSTRPPEASDTTLFLMYLEMLRKQNKKRKRSKKAIKRRKKH